MQQGSEEWFAVRAGKFTASQSKALMTNGRGKKPSATRATLINKIAAERMSGKMAESYSSASMDRGTEMEPEARDFYSFQQGVSVREEAFIMHPSWGFCGCSPDGLIGEDGLIEIKCPSTPAKHLDALRNGSHANEYKWQFQHQLLVTGRKWVDCVSYNPNFDGLEMAIKRVEPDAEMQEQLSAALVQGNLEVEAIIAQMNTLKGTA